MVWRVVCFFSQRRHSPPPPRTFLFLNPSRTAVPFWGQTIQIPSSLPPKRDCGTKRVKKKGGTSHFPRALPVAIQGKTTKTCIRMQADESRPFLFLVRFHTWVRCPSPPIDTRRRKKFVRRTARTVHERHTRHIHTKYTRTYLVYYCCMRILYLLEDPTINNQHSTPAG